LSEHSRVGGKKRLKPTAGKKKVIWGEVLQVENRTGTRVGKTNLRRQGEGYVTKKEKEKQNYQKKESMGVWGTVKWHEG